MLVRLAMVVLLFTITIAPFVYMKHERDQQIVRFKNKVSGVSSLGKRPNQVIKIMGPPESDVLDKDGDELMNYPRPYGIGIRIQFQAGASVSCEFWDD